MTKSLESLAQQVESERAAISYKQAKDLIKRRDKQLIDAIKQLKVNKQTTNKISAWLSSDYKDMEKRAKKSIQLNLPLAAYDQVMIVLNERLPEDSKLAMGVIDALASIQDRLAEVEVILAKVPDESALEGVVAERGRVSGEIAQIEARIEVIAKDIQATETKIHKLKLDIEEFEREAKLTQLRHKLQGRVVDTADRINGALAVFKQRVVERHLARLEELIYQSYRDLLRKGGLVGAVRIDPTTLQVSILDTRGQHIEPFALSAGERQLLATSLLWGLARASGRALPVIIDTPLGRLDGSHRTNLVQQYFPNASHQVILLSTDEEISGRYYRDLLPYVGKQYEIYFDNESGTSIIRPGYPFEKAA